MPTGTKRMLYVPWTALICLFALIHAFHLTADFPNHTPWFHDWAKYTDEGWYGNAAVRAHLFGNWYVPEDFNPAVALPVWPFLEWVLFFVTGVSIGAARALAITCFFATLGLSYLLLRRRARPWVRMLALTLIVTSPFIYCFSRLAILEPLLTALTLAALNLAVGLAETSKRMRTSVAIGAIFALMMLTKTTAIFLLPAIGWAMAMSLRRPIGRIAGCLTAAGATALALYGAWLTLVVRAGLFADFKYLFLINDYKKPHDPWWILSSFWWSFHGGLWVDHILIPLAGVMVVGALAGWRTRWGRQLVLDPIFGASVLAVGGFILFMTVQNHPQPRYFAVVAVFCMLIVALAVGQLCQQIGVVQQIGRGALAVAVLAIVLNATWTLSYAVHPEYSFIEAARNLARYVEQHPNGRPLLVATSGDQITLMAHVQSLDDDFGTVPLHEKIEHYQPGWFATWNDLDPGALADLHTHYSVEQVAVFPALDDPERQRLVLFKLHPLPDGLIRDQVDENLGIALPGDKIEIELR